ncbi:hypothetical protein [Microbacterium sediminicola]|uniref:hypothetical protein n=1 Tax=Microbacterium sediminicola TaxID=415210 RepID=UPI0031D2D596
MPRSDRQRIERVSGSRRARLTPAPGTGDEPVEGDLPDASGTASSPAEGPNDARMRGDVPPHY